MPEFEEIYIIVISILGPAIVGTLAAYFKTKIKCLDKIDKRSFRQSKGMLNMAAKLDELKEQLHPGTFKPTFYQQMQRDLTDEKGNL